MTGSQTTIRRRISAIILLASTTMVALALMAFIVYDLLALRDSLTRHLSVVARVIADNSAADLAFNSESDARDVLAALHADSQITGAALYDAQNRVFVTYPTGEPSEDFPSVPAPRAGHSFEHGRFVLFQPVVRGGVRLGTVYLRADMGNFYHRMEFSVGVAALIILSSLVVTLFLSKYLQKRISDPIVSLAGVARAVSEQRDYSVRASPSGSDNTEVNLLTEAFNGMLAHIEEQTGALRENEARLRLALGASGTCAWDWDISTNQILWDANSAALFGRNFNEFGHSYQDFLNLIHPEDREHIRQLRQEALDQRKDLVSEFRVVWNDGSIHFLHSRGKAFYDASGRPVRMTGVSQDVTGRHRHEEASRYLASIVESSDDAIVGKALDGTITSWNHGAEMLYGYTAAEAVGQSILMVVPPDRHAEEEEILRRIARGERIVHYETFRRRKNGAEIQVSLTISPIKDASGKIVGASKIARDITERKRAENEILRLNGQLQRHTSELEQRVRERTAELTAANQELESFAYSVAHDLRAPLRHIDAFTKILRDDFAASLPAEANHVIGTILNGCRHMSQLVDDLLNLARVSRQEIKRESVPLKPVVEEIISELKREAPERQIEWRMGNLPVVTGDPGLMRQAFSNLISNAVKYTRTRHPAVIEIGSQSDGAEKVIYVRDNGVGFSMKYAGKLFGAFQRLHRPEEFEGTGVGLAIVDRVVRRHGGRVWAEAEVNKGATFYLTLNGTEKTGPGGH